jgi:2-aminoadipate transaminase
MRAEKRPVLEYALAKRAQRLARPLHAEGGHAISFDSGYAFPGIFPDLTRAAERALTTYRSQSLQYGTPFGLAEMREWIAEYIRAEGGEAAVDEILVVNGAKRGIELVCRLLADEGDSVVVTAPMYFTAIPILRSFGLEFIEVSQDEEGMDVDALSAELRRRESEGLKRPKFIYQVTDFHNPTGVTMSLRRREALVALATSLGIPILEDNPYRKLRFEGSEIPSLKALDRDGAVLEVGTFSKLLAPGLRIGWVCAPQPLVARMAQLKADGGTCPLTQRIIVEWLTAGGLDPHLQRARAAYHEHRDLMIAAVRRELPEASFAIPQGGYYLWLKFPENVNADQLAERAYDAGVSPIAGSVFFAREDAGHPKNYLRLAYSRATPDEIDRGVNLLATAYHSMK